MNYLSLKTTKNAGSNRFLLLVFILVTNISVFAQTEKNLVDVNTVAVGTTTKQANVSTVSASNSNSMHFILWFMGSKQDPNSTISIEGINAKKQIITSGVAPNRLLIKAFLKKAVNLENMIA
ncbi:hypothetical protein EKM01_03580 [Flavobacterium sp. RSP46]|uniref:hypothetical protein n=1 Tax=Flavobacterium sp. RSP46 TaxID=2497486 RepID=UPI000F895E24|nr:hypothetical protein [Flavobacterium sp. RSP46]RTY93189.1 hypothetical protein EKM01_03580 [Flavobacterium sp. RSP46]